MVSPHRRLSQQVGPLASKVIFFLSPFLTLLSQQWPPPLLHFLPSLSWLEQAQRRCTLYTPCRIPTASMCSSKIRARHHSSLPLLCKSPRLISSSFFLATSRRIGAQVATPINATATRFLRSRVSSGSWAEPIIIGKGTCYILCISTKIWILLKVLGGFSRLYSISCEIPTFNTTTEPFQTADSIC